MSDCETPADEAALNAMLARLGINVRRHAHPPLHTVEESRALRGEMPGGHTKNLFLKARKGGFCLAVCLEDRAISVNALSRMIGTKRLSFANADDLWARLGVRPGAVTPFALINDPDHEVRLVLDAQMMELELLNFHPLHNEATLTIASADLARFFRATGHAPVMADFDALEAQAAKT